MIYINELNDMNSFLRNHLTNSDLTKAGGVFTPPAPRTKGTAGDERYVRGDNPGTLCAYIRNNTVSGYLRLPSMR